MPQGRRVPDEVRDGVVRVLIAGSPVSVVARDFGLARITVDRIAIAAGIAPARGTTGPQRPEGLVDRDAEILRLAAAGESFAEIGRRFRLSRERVRFIVAREQAQRSDVDDTGAA